MLVSNLLVAPSFFFFPLCSDTSKWDPWTPRFEQLCMWSDEECIGRFWLHGHASRPSWILGTLIIARFPLSHLPSASACLNAPQQPVPGRIPPYSNNVYEWKQLAFFNLSSAPQWRTTSASIHIGPQSGQGHGFPRGGNPITALCLLFGTR